MLQTTHACGFGLYCTMFWTKKKQNMKNLRKWKILKINEEYCELRIATCSAWKIIFVILFSIRIFNASPSLSPSLHVYSWIIWLIRIPINWKIVTRVNKNISNELSMHYYCYPIIKFSSKTFYWMHNAISFGPISSFGSHCLPLEWKYIQNDMHLLNDVPFVPAQMGEYRYWYYSPAMRKTVQQIDKS